MASVTLGTVDGKAISPANISFSTSGSNAIVAGVAGQVVRVYKIILVTTGANTLTFLDGTTAISGGFGLPSNGSIALDMDGTPWFSTSAGNAFNISTSGATAIGGVAYFTQG